MSDWIKVEDRLPQIEPGRETSAAYIVYGFRKNGEDGEGSYQTVARLFSWNNNWQNIVDTDPYGSEDETLIVSHWREWPDDPVDWIAPAAKDDEPTHEHLILRPCP